MTNSLICDRCKEAYRFTPFVIRGKKIEINIICPLCEQDLRCLVDDFIAKPIIAQQIHKNIRKSKKRKDL